uniref:Uncharacterized protein n=1 Tax=Rhizophagus irregularis (strain DAOM 181602 / DAOM 197198 / MUCL 43194) TaxID=747089 RepID=U9TU80_RHIID
MPGLPIIQKEAIEKERFVIRNIIDYYLELFSFCSKRFQLAGSHRHEELVEAVKTMGGELVDKDIKTEVLVQVLLSNKDVDMIIRSTGSDILMIILINNGYSNILLSARK